MELMEHVDLDYNHICNLSRCLTYKWFEEQWKKKYFLEYFTYLKKHKNLNEACEVTMLCVCVPPSVLANGSVNMLIRQWTHTQ
jgi:hypothetical protein